MVRRLLVLLAAAAACLALAACGGSASKRATAGTGGRTDATAVAPERPVFLGVTAGAPLLTPGIDVDAQLRTMAASGAQTLRAAFYWRDMQPYASASAVPAGQRSRFVAGSDAVPTGFAATDRLVAAAARSHVELLPVLIGAPAWAARHPGQVNSPPAGTAPYAAFARTMVQRYGPRGSFWRAHPALRAGAVRDWQIWNEPDHLFYWSDQPFAADYVRLLRAANTAVKAADPGARVVMAGFAGRSWELLAQVYRAGARGAFDVAATHPYTFEVANVLKILRLDRAALRAADDGNRPLWVTELTWSSARGRVTHPFGFETTESDQAARLARAIAAIARERGALGVDRVYWESWITYDRDRGNSFDFSGLREYRGPSDVRDKPALAAFRAVARMLGQ